MVNAGLPDHGRAEARSATRLCLIFPIPARVRSDRSKHGFALVRDVCPSRHHFLNDENRSNFRKTRRKLASNMRKIDGTERTSPSMASASVSATTVKTPWRTKGRVMFFLIRTAFWLSIVIMLLPTPDSAKVPESGIGAAQAVTAASATVSDMSQFCSRQPETCQIGSQALTHFGHKAQASAKWLYEKFTSKSEPPGTAAPAKALAETDSSQNTLTSADTVPAWRGAAQRQAEVKR
jgi:hypothetical protein